MAVRQQSGRLNLVWQAPSLRGRIVLLAATVVCLLLITLCVLISVLRSTQTNVVSRSQTHLVAVARSMASEYATRSDRSVTISSTEAAPSPRRGDDLPQPPPPPPPPKFRPSLRPMLPEPAGERSQVLERITAHVLQDETGVEGGFFRPEDQRLIGYAFPTHEGPGDRRALPARETPDIVHLAAAAYASRQLQQDQFYGSRDVVLFAAVPVCETTSCKGGPTGSVWLMQHLPGVEMDRKRALLWSAFGFGAIACATVLLAFLVLRQVGQGTAAVVDRLKWMESDLSYQPHPATVRLAEFHRVLDGLDRLGDTIQIQIERERELQSRVRQNERLVAIGQLAAGVAHELRNPLATIRLRAQMAQRKTQEENTSQASSVILAEVDRLDTIIERLLDFSRPIRLNPSTTNLSQLAESAVRRWAVRFPAITFRYGGAGEISAVVDAMRLEQVVDNLFDNAVHQLVESRVTTPVIEARCGQDTGEVYLCVADNGGGFSPAALESATEPFFTTRAKGTGLGLAVSKEIVSASGGSLTLTNEGGGALVCIQFPASEHH